MSGIEAVKSSAREPAERERVASASREYRSTKWGVIRLRTGYDATTWVLNGAGDRLLFLLGAYWVLAGPPWHFTEPLTAGALLTFVMYQRSFLFPIRLLAVDVNDRYEDARASCRPMLALLASQARREGGAEDLLAIDVTEGRVAFETSPSPTRGPASRPSRTSTRVQSGTSPSSGGSPKKSPGRKRRSSRTPVSRDGG